MTAASMFHYVSPGDFQSTLIFIERGSKYTDIKFVTSHAILEGACAWFILVEKHKA